MFAPLGIRKHRKSGKVVNSSHFSGRSKSDSKKKNKSTKKQRRLKRYSHINKYL